MNPAIRVENLSKRYRLSGRPKTRYRTLRDSITDFAASPWRLLRRQRRGTKASTAPIPPGDLWALKNVSFEVQRGEVVGIIGRNGAGKSTLLKILSRISEPSAGRIELCGRVGSLLEVGTGFHSELSGRENVYLNGAILGMTRREITRKFHEIAAFAEMERFLDSPIKCYSSGMQMRLAFAVAAHLDPEILIMDEVLAVGDAAFQRKCLQKVEDIGASGRTVLFVSHNMPAVTRLCPRVILLSDSVLARDGPAHQVVNEFLRSGLGMTASRTWPDPERAPGNDVVRLRGLRVLADNDRIASALDIRQPVHLEMEYAVLSEGHSLIPTFYVLNEEGTIVFTAHDRDPQWRRRSRPAGCYHSKTCIPGNFLAEGTFIIGAAVWTHDSQVCHFYEPDGVAFQVIDSLDGDSARGDFTGPMPGLVRPLLTWSTEFYSEGSNR